MQRQRRSRSRSMIVDCRAHFFKLWENASKHRAAGTGRLDLSSCSEVGRTHHAFMAFRRLTRKQNLYRCRKMRTSSGPVRCRFDPGRSRLEDTTGYQNMRCAIQYRWTQRNHAIVWNRAPSGSTPFFFKANAKIARFLTILCCARFVHFLCKQTPVSNAAGRLYCQTNRSTFPTKRPIRQRSTSIRHANSQLPFPRFHKPNRHRLTLIDANLQNILIQKDIQRDRIFSCAIQRNRGQIRPLVPLVMLSHPQQLRWIIQNQLITRTEFTVPILFGLFAFPVQA